MNVGLQPVLESEMVLLRPLKETDFKELFAVASDPLIWEQHQNKNRHDHKEFKSFFTEAIAGKSALIIVDKKTDSVIGSSRFKVIDEFEKVVEIGWSFLARAYWGGSFNREFKKLMVNYSLQYFNKVIFYVHPENFRSQRAMEKLGAKNIGNQANSWVLPENKAITYELDRELE